MTNTGFSYDISDAEFTHISKLVYDSFGINLTEKKRSLVSGRLQKILKKHSANSFSEYIEIVEKDKSGSLLVEMIDRISTNHTFFYREKEHFDFLVDTALPQVTQTLKKQQSNDLRMWCAGCSYGDEAYMLIMSMMEFFGPEYSNLNAGLLATDISTQALAQAMSGVYPEDRVKLVPQSMKNKYFRQLPDGNWTLVDKVKQEITFRRFNLMNESFGFKKLFHIIFCRNVMIYFDQVTRDNLISRFASTLLPGGYLFIGHSESLGRNQDSFDYIMPAVYRRKTND